MSDCKLSTFLETFPTQLQFTKNKNSPNLRVFWSQTEPSKSNTSSATLAKYDKYRLRCMKYQYDIDVKNKTEVDRDDPLMVINAFENHLPRVVNMRVHQWSPLALALVLVSLSVLYGGRVSLLFFSVLKRELERVGLRTFHTQECWSRKRICGLKHATDEIEKALKIVCESHDLSVAQVWIAYENDIQTKPTFAVKLIGYCAGSKNDLKHYYDTCDMFPLKIGEGLPGKALQTYEPRFCRNINELTDNGLFAALPYATITEYSCLVICLRSIDTGDVDYAFEFLWPKSRNYLILLEVLLLTLKSFLPSFKFASGALLVDKLRVIDVENSTGTGIGFFEILQGNRLSQLPKKALEERKRLLVDDDCVSSYACTLKRESNQLVEGPRGRETLKRVSNVLESQEHNFVKRKLSDICESQTESRQKDSRENFEVSSSSNNSVRYPVIEEVVKNVSEDRRRLLAEDDCISSPACTFKRESNQLVGGIRVGDTLKRKRNVLESQEHNLFVKRKLSNLCESQNESSQENNRENYEDSASSNNSVMYPGKLVIRAKYGDEKILRYFPVSSTFADIKKNVYETYNLGPSSYTIDYLDSDCDEWIRLDNEFGWENCITYWRGTDYKTIQVLVQYDFS